MLPIHRLRLSPSNSGSAALTSCSSASALAAGQLAGAEQQNTVVATVGDAESRGSDVMTVIGMLPPQMLVPMALQQLIFRELILEQARSQNLADDPEVVALVESSAQTAEDDAMVQVWLEREMATVVTDEAVQQAYSDTQAQGQQDLPPIDALRPQIEQHLRQQAVQDIQARLRQGADIVLYDPSSGQSSSRRKADCSKAKPRRVMAAGPRATRVAKASRMASRPRVRQAPRRPRVSRPKATN